jgi:allantoicase
MRLTVMPDGGVARLGVLGPILPDPWDFDGGEHRSRLGAQRGLRGGLQRRRLQLATAPDPLGRGPRNGRGLGDPTPTGRRRDFVVFGLGIVRRTRQAVVETTCFWYNASESIALRGSGGAPSPPVGRKRLGPGSGTDGT